ncbi:MAG: SPFH domain-containing protein [Chloroflexota bacterium]
MKWFGKVVSQTNLGYRWGFRFIEDNKIIPVLRHGLFHRYEGPGHFWIGPYESLLAPIHIGLRNANFRIDSLMTSDRIPHRVTLVVTFAHDPRNGRSEVQAGLARMSPQQLQVMIENHVDNALRLMVGQVSSESFLRPNIKLKFEHNLYRRLTTDFRWAGVRFLEEEIMIKAVKPAAYHQQTLLNKADLNELFKLIETSDDLEKIRKVAEIHRMYERSSRGGKQIHIHETSPPVAQPKREMKPTKEKEESDIFLNPLFRHSGSTIAQSMESH